MDHLDQLRHQLKLRLFGLLVAANVVVVAGFWLLQHYTQLSNGLILLITIALGLALAFILAGPFSDYTLQPLAALRKIILHISPDASPGLAAPDLNKLGLGKEMVTSLSAQIYQLASAAEHTLTASRQQVKDLHNNFIAQNLPLPLLVIDSAQNIRYTNEAAAQYIGLKSADMIGKNVYMVLDMSFPSEDTFDNWLKEVKTKNATAAYSWERVRLNVRDSHPIRLFDLAAYYNRGNAEGNETMLVLFDHTKMYSQDDQAVSFMALSVHELRTPLTLLRGYIEVFEDELEDSIDGDLKSFMMKMHAQAEQLMDYVNNILNVARVDDDQLELKLLQEDWPTVLKSSIEMISLRAKVRGIKLSCQITKDLPPVGVDRLSISEVINNLVDNAIKYSANSKVINISTYLNKEGAIETTVQDFGKGMPTSVLPNLFTKFYRDHRNRAQIGGTGLGLYLSKAIVTAHGGTIWVRSKEGEGSTFGFTLIPYAQLAESLKHDNNQSITRSAHGWIKNHSLYRR
ncbi:MAG TPA: ATP-binding protein [Candidatus Saccharimonadales bacterium]|jgi:signal transduction histidine kinase|nr:ATP-binding protein [Candidatus Saccharimonadales bacterium]